MLQNTNFIALAKRETNGRKRIRFLALAHFQDGLNKAAIARVLKVSRASVNKWVANYLNIGLPGLDDKPSPGRPAKLTPLQSQKLADFINQRSHSSKGGRLIAADIQQYIEQHFAVRYQPSNVYRLMHELGFSWITSRSKHPKQSQQAQDSFKKTANGNDLSDPGPYSA
jgi:transposase